LTDPPPATVPRPPRAHSLWAHARAVLLLLLLLILIAGVVYPLTIGGLGIALHQSTVNTTNNTSGSGELLPPTPPGWPRSVANTPEFPGLPGIPAPPGLGEKGAPFPPTFLYSSLPGGLQEKIPGATAHSHGISGIEYGTGGR
jgi:hypothetical protein